MSRNEQIHYILQGLVGRSQDVEGALLVTMDGLPLASALPQGADEDRVAAMGAAALSMGCPHRQRAAPRLAGAGARQG